MTDDRQRRHRMVQAFVDGDQRAFDELMRRHEDRVFAVCLRVMGDRELALDATQETFVTLYRKAHLYKEEAAFSTWLYRVAVNTCYDQHRRRARQRTEMIPEGMEPADPTAGDAFVVGRASTRVGSGAGIDPHRFSDRSRPLRS